MTAILKNNSFHKINQKQRQKGLAQVAQNVTISRIITNSALYTGRQWNDVFVSFVMTFTPLDSLLLGGTAIQNAPLLDRNETGGSR